MNSAAGETPQCGVSAVKQQRNVEQGVEVDWLDAAMVAILVGFPICYLVAQILALVRWRGWIRAGALIPPFGWTVWAAVFLTDLAWDSTSHNLFPFEILIGAVASLIFLALLKVAALMVRA